MTGFENAANVAEETRNPSRVFPRALLGGMALAGAMYLLVAFIASMVAPLDRLAGSEGALLEVVKAGPMAVPAAVFSVIALVAVTNTTLVALVAQSRILYGMGRQGVVPRMFSRTHHSRHAPWIAIIFSTVIVVALMLITDVENLATVTILFLIAVYAMVCLAALVLRRNLVNHDHYRAPTVLLYLGIAANLTLMGYTAVTEPSSLVYCGVMLVIGGVLYLVNNVVTSKAELSEPDESYHAAD